MNGEGTTATPRRRVNYWALWFGFLGSPAAWSVNELSAYAVVAHSCFPRVDPLPRPVFAGTWWLAFGDSVVSLAIALTSLWVAVRLWREYQPRDRGGWRNEMLDVTEARAYRYLAFSGILFGGIFSALIFFHWIALIVLPTCVYY